MCVPLNFQLIDRCDNQPHYWDGCHTLQGWMSQCYLIGKILKEGRNKFKYLIVLNS